MSLLIAAGLGVFAAAPVVAAAPAQPAAPRQASAAAPAVSASCSAPKSTHEARCFALKLNGVAGGTGLRSAAEAPHGLGPADLAAAYGLPADGGGGATVAIVDAYDNPNAASDLAVYRAQFGEAPLAPGQFVKVNQSGQQGNYPAANADWGAEISLDLDMVSAVAPKANILLVEAESAGFDDLGAAVDKAVALGADYVSNSYGSGYTATPGSGEPSFISDYEHYYDHPGVAVVASSGDGNYGVSFPASSPHVTSVGGTSLVRDPSTARGWTESVWNSHGGGPGSGCSVIEPKPSFQKDTGCGHRTVADVSAVADPVTGVAVYDTFGQSGWAQYGGTSASSPIIAATYAVAGPVAEGTYPNSYPYAHSGSVNDVTTGSNGTCAPAYLCTAGPGYDGPTGLGTPNGTAAFTGQQSGVLAGTVTDAAGKPIAGAKVVAGGDSPATTETAADGTYRMKLVPGDTDISVSAFGYVTKTAHTTVTADATTTADVSLAAAPMVTVSGKVADGSGHGWPLPATITVDDGNEIAPVHNDPATGAYSLRLPAGGSYTLHTSTTLDGYLKQDAVVTTGAKDTVRDIALSVETLASVTAAPGYAQHDTGATETFEGSTSLPAGWTTKATEGPAWAVGTRNPAETGSESAYNYVSVGGDYGVFGTVDASLTTPEVQIPAGRTPFLTFATLVLDGTDQLDYSTDHGASWTTLAKLRPGTQGYQTYELPVSSKPVTVQWRFHASSDVAVISAWNIDDVRAGSSWATPEAGGLITGDVQDTLAGQALDDATVSVEGTSGSTTSALLHGGNGAQGDRDGAFELFSARTGHRTLTATAYGYDTATAKADVRADRITDVRIAAHSGRLEVSGGPVGATVSGHGSATGTLTLTNTGDGPMTVKLNEFPGAATTGTGTATRSARSAGKPAVSPLRVPLTRASGKPGLPATLPALKSAAAGAKAAQAAAGDGPAWSALPDLPVMGWSRVAGTYNGVLYTGLGGDDAFDSLKDLYAYDTASGTWHTEADAPYASVGPVGGFIGGKLYVAGGQQTDPFAGNVGPIQIYDPAKNAWTTGASNPAATTLGGGAVVDGKLYAVGGERLVLRKLSGGNIDIATKVTSTVSVYDPKTDTWHAAHPYPHEVIAESCSALSGKLYCAGGQGYRDAYVYNPAADNWKPIASMPLDMSYAATGTGGGKMIVAGGAIDGGSVAVNAVYAYDPTMNWWTALPLTDSVSLGATGAAGPDGFSSVGGWQVTGWKLSGYPESGPTDVPWLSADRTTLTVEPGRPVTVRLRLSARGTSLTGPGTVTAALGIETDSVYGGVTVPVALTVQAPTASTGTGTTGAAHPAGAPPAAVSPRGETATRPAGSTTAARS
ncbi:carboxypeptidase regulatory-like domain-containing protein [Actinacidiphila acidipaludis]|uniref:Carboxypeptidase-like regulatory domain-containing protein n=1 Tax=Actinacidiphila acidipaludis TaxID=2873382 RepID=A0ABS7QJE2_9ACTN|nr:carboxypeptidase regulatory-like domain-containing protein [Streptomyces acidipaludis]MBY8883098.1 carboxypeptidase-like regulatory domain-containing protein [Streptomyces acidipaludis]